eukprot:Phypoly_transcript_13421.p1 GENE.Phypoly_transcript_13421~~Phypoly_transcript_13421.p1  ORF type:complete len:287 (+),score=54.84 Phypoly_transcript_13421:158-1018(+)
MRIVVAGATGNTGRPCVEALSKKGHNVVAITRDPQSAVSQELARLPGVEVVLVKNAFTKPIDRAYILSRDASFVDETELIRLAKEAGVKYIVKLATGARAMKNVYAKIAAGRSHLAVEFFLERGDVPWTSLRPNTFYTNTGVDFASVLTTKEFKFMHGKNGTAALDAQDVGEIAAELLSLEDPSAHYGKIYEISGTEDINVEAITAAYKKVLGIDVKGSLYTRDDLIALFKMLLPNIDHEKTVDGILDLIENEPSTAAYSKTSPELLALHTPKRTFEDFLRKIYQK